MTPNDDVQELAAKLEAELKRYGLQPGWRLPSEERLAQMHGVSRGVIRSAISLLRERGVVASRRGGGTFVNPLDADAVASVLSGYAARTEADKAFDELLHLRMLVEGECARELAKKRRKEALIRLQESFDRMKSSLNSPVAFAKADLEFHRTLVNESGNALFRAIMQALSGIFESYSKHSHAVVDRRPRVLAEHEAILEAVLQGDSDAAANLMSAHIQRAKANLLADHKKRSE